MWNYDCSKLIILTERCRLRFIFASVGELYVIRPFRRKNESNFFGYVHLKNTAILAFPNCINAGLIGSVLLATIQLLDVHSQSSLPVLQHRFLFVYLPLSPPPSPNHWTGFFSRMINPTPPSKGTVGK